MSIFITVRCDVQSSIDPLLNNRCAETYRDIAPYVTHIDGARNRAAIAGWGQVQICLRTLDVCPKHFSTSKIQLTGKLAAVLIDETIPMEVAIIS